MIKRRHAAPVLTMLLLISAAGCGPGAVEEEGNMPTTVATVSITSTAFKDNENIPVRYTCDAQNVSPALDWGSPPAGTRSFALTVFDPDASGGGFVHWVIYNIPAGARRLPEGVPVQATLSDGTIQGNNGGAKLGYTGPCPPAGKPHHYHFDLYALDRVLDLKSGATYAQLNAAIKGHILAQGALTGIYQR